MLGCLLLCLWQYRVTQSIYFVQFSYTATSSTAKVQDKHHPLLAAQKYEPTVKKAKAKFGERRPVLQLDSVLEGAQTVAEYQRHKRKLSGENVVVNPYKSKHQTTIQCTNTMNTDVNTTKRDRFHVSDVYQSRMGVESIQEKRPNNSASDTVLNSNSVVFVHPLNNKHNVKSKPRMNEISQSQADLQNRNTVELYLKARG